MYPVLFNSKLFYEAYFLTSLIIQNLFIVSNSPKMLGYSSIQWFNSQKTLAVKISTFPNYAIIFFLENVSRTTNGPTTASPSKSIENPPEPRILATRIPTPTRIRIVKPRTTRWEMTGVLPWKMEGWGSSERK